MNLEIQRVAYKNVLESHPKRFSKTTCRYSIHSRTSYWVDLSCVQNTCKGSILCSVLSKTFCVPITRINSVAWSQRSVWLVSIQPCRPEVLACQSSFTFHPSSLWWHYSSVQLLGSYGHIEELALSSLWSFSIFRFDSCLHLLYFYGLVRTVSYQIHKDIELNRQWSPGIC